MDYRALLPYAQSDVQREALLAIIEHGSQKKAAKALGKDKRSIERNVRTIKRAAARMGYSPEHDMHRTVPEGFQVKGVSTYYNDEGKPTAQWVKSTADLERQREMMLEAVKAMGEDLPREQPAEAPGVCVDDLLNLYVITDYHLGMLSWGEETGANWDTDLAEDTLVAWFAQAIRTSPEAEFGVFAQLGDFLHWDGLDAVTPTNRHVLDADTRFQNLVRVAIRVIRRVVNMLLQKHNRVHVLMAEGNHDLASSIWLREWFAAVYEDEPRITVDTNPDPYYCVEHGQTSLFFHHGHKRKPAAVDSVFAAKYREVFGRTQHSYAHMGHLHHVDQKETNLMIVEQHRTLAAPDAHASRGGWMSGRDAKVITYSKRHGEVSRSTISYEMVS